MCVVDNSWRGHAGFWLLSNHESMRIFFSTGNTEFSVITNTAPEMHASFSFVAWLYTQWRLTSVSLLVIVIAYCQFIIWTNVDLLSYGPYRQNSVKFEKKNKQIFFWDNAFEYVYSTITFILFISQIVYGKLQNCLSDLHLTIWFGSLAYEWITWACTWDWYVRYVLL